VIQFRFAPVELLVAIKRSLVRALEGPRRVLLQLCGLSNFLAVDTVYRRERVCGRLIVEQARLASLIEPITALGLAWRIAKFGFCELPSPVPGTQHDGLFTFERGEDTKAVLYFAIDPFFAQGIEEAEANEEHQLVGTLFGYPTCCVDAYLSGDQAIADRIPQTIPHRGPFPALLNPLLPYLYPGIGLIFHFPCSPECEASRDLALHRIGLLAALTPDAAQISLLGKGISLYGDKTGVALVTRYQSVGSDEFECQEILARDGTERIINLSTGSTRLRLTGPRKFLFGGHAIDSRHQFAAVFL
jgi:hypothetical protein